MAAGMVQGAAVGFSRGLQQGWLASEPIARALAERAAIVGGVASIEIGGTAAIPTAISTYGLTRIGVTGAFAIGGTLLGAVGGTITGAAESYGGSCAAAGH